MEDNKTLRELWESKGLGPSQVAALSGVSVTTLYKMNHKEKVLGKNIAKVCKALEITRQEYNNLIAES